MSTHYRSPEGDGTPQAYFLFVRGMTLDRLTGLIGRERLRGTGEGNGWVYAEAQLVGEHMKYAGPGEIAAIALDGASELICVDRREIPPVTNFDYYRNGSLVIGWLLGEQEDEVDRAMLPELWDKLLAADVVGPGAESRFEEDEEFNLGGRAAIPVIVEHFGLPWPGRSPE
ncbi:hypothetical protein [Streptomyces niveus]|uniref:hypothetical protein n=1 Tax=Streptomyces niveus TaxID=193462 RepID=UPI00084C7F0D|nr:hypothetical protein [Streptomyces niveus]